MMIPASSLNNRHGQSSLVVALLSPMTSHRLSLVVPVPLFSSRVRHFTFFVASVLFFFLSLQSVVDVVFLYWSTRTLCITVLVVTLTFLCTVLCIVLYLFSVINSEL